MLIIRIVYPCLLSSWGRELTTYWYSDDGSGIASIVLGDIYGGHDDSIVGNQPELTSGLVAFPLVLKAAVNLRL